MLLRLRFAVCHAKPVQNHLCVALLAEHQLISLLLNLHANEEICTARNCDLEDGFKTDLWSEPWPRGR